MGSIPRVSGKQMLRFLSQEGFVLRRVRGSHHLMRKGNVMTIVPVYANRDLRPGTFHSILKDINMTVPEFLRKYRK